MPTQLLNKGKNMRNKKPLVLFTGGMDSAVILANTLKSTNCDVLYVRNNKPDSAIQKEVEAQTAIIKVLSTQAFQIEESYDLVVGDLRDEGDIELTNIAKTLYAALTVVDSYQHSRLIIGGVKGDRIVKEYKHIAEMWRTMVRLSKWQSIILEMPLQNRSKRDVMEMLAPDLVPFTWSCTNPVNKQGKIITCGHCQSCQLLTESVSDMGLPGQLFQQTLVACR